MSNTLFGGGPSKIALETLIHQHLTTYFPNAAKSFNCSLDANAAKQFFGDKTLVEFYCQPKHAAVEKVCKHIVALIARKSEESPSDTDLKQIIAGAGFIPSEKVCSGLVGAICSILFHKNSVSLESMVAFASPRLMALTHKSNPRECVLEAAHKVTDLDCRVFMYSSDLGHFENRYCAIRSPIKTPLISTVARVLLHENAVPIIAGPSGGGKTMSVVLLSSLSAVNSLEISTEVPTVVAMLNVDGLSTTMPKHPSLRPCIPAQNNLVGVCNCRVVLTELGNLFYSQPNCGSPPVRKLAPDEAGPKVLRDQLVIDRVVAMLQYVVTPDVFHHMGCMEEPDRLRLIVFLDEMGGEERMDAVRALCSVGSAKIKEALVKSLGFELPNVDLKLAMAGTGIESDENAPGSNEANYTMIYAYDGTEEVENHRKANRAIFASHFFDINIETLSGCISSFGWQMISENARMSAILGQQVSDTTCSLGEPRRVLASMDIVPFVGPAILAFRQRNALSGLKVKNIEEVLHKVIRMHWFPNLLTVDAGRVRTKYGLIVDKVRETLPIKYGASRNMFPFFSVSLLSMMSGNPIVSRSLTSGASLEVNGCVLLYFLACAANSDEMFLKALDHNDGVLVPLTTDDVDGGDPNQDRYFAAFIHDMDSCDDSTKASDEDTGMSESDLDHGQQESGLRHPSKDMILSAVQQRLAAFKEVERLLKKPLYIAVFKTFEKANFADAFVFIGSFLFLFKMKDYAGGYELQGMPIERWKMGAVTDNVVESLLEKIKAESEENNCFANCAELFDGSVVEPQPADFIDDDSAQNESEQRTKYFADLAKLTASLRTTLQNLKTQPSCDSSVSQLKQSLIARSKARWFLRPRKLVVGLVREWFKATGVKITRVFRVFVTPTPVVFKKAFANGFDEHVNVPPISKSEKAWSFTIDGRDRFVSVDAVKFMPFESSQKARNAPLAFGGPKVFNIAKNT